MENEKPWSAERLSNTNQQRLMLMENIASLELQVANKKRQLALFDTEIADNLPYGKTDSALDYIPEPRIPLMSEVIRSMIDRVREAAQVHGFRLRD